MFRRKTRNKNSYLNVTSSNRGSDIVRPDNTSLIVNESDTESSDMPKELTSIFSDDEENKIGSSFRKSSSLMKSLSQKKQSTPLVQSLGKEEENLRNQNMKDRHLHIPTNSQAKKTCFFEQILKAGGASPLPGNSSFLMTEDQAVFAIKVNNKLMEDSRHVQKFVNALKENVENVEYLHKMLAHTLTAENCEVARGPVQEPLMRILLNVDCLRADLLNLLLDAVASIVINNKVENEKVQLISTILRQMRFLTGKKDVKVASKLFEIIHVASLNVKREIIFLLPEIVPQEETEDTCFQLLELLKFDEMLTHVIIDAMTNLPLNKALRCQVCLKVLNRLDKCPVEFLPSLVQYIVTKADAEEHVDMINGFRKNLPFSLQHDQRKELRRGDENHCSDESSYIKLTFENLKFSVMTSKLWADSWFRVISNQNSPSDFRCVDWVMLIIFYCCLFGKKSQILQIIRSKIKSSVLTKAQVQAMFKCLVVIAEEYCPTILELASSLLKSFEQKLADFGAFLYKECFLHFQFFMKQIVISDILVHVGTAPPCTVNAALGILRELCTDEKECLNQHTSSILGLLVKVQDLELAQVRLLMDVIAELVFFESNGIAGQDELQIFIRKQLMSSKCEQYKKGIAGAVVFGKHAVGRENCEEPDFPQINSLFELATGLNWTSETKRGFFNDEFATMSKESSLNRLFLEVWSKKTWSLVMENLFVKDIDVEYSNFPTSLQYSVELADIEKIVFPIVAFVMLADKGDSLSIPLSVMPSALRLLWCLERNPKRVLPVFSASVTMPEATLYDNFTSLDDVQKKKVLDSLFLCSNFLIESVNALCAYEMIAEAMLRVKQLVQVRKLIARHISMISDYVPPPCQFYVPVQKINLKRKTCAEKKARKGRKRKLDESEASNVSLDSQQTSEVPAVPSALEENVVLSGHSAQEVDLRPYFRYFRELDYLTYTLLTTDFDSGVLKRTKSPAHSFSVSSQPGKVACLETCDILFLLEDLVYKCEQTLKSGEALPNFKNKSSVSLIQKIGAENLTKAAVEIMPGLLTKMEKFSKYCETILESNDWVYDSRGLYLQDVNYVKLALAAALKFVAEVISWRGFERSSSALRDILTILSGQKNSPEVDASPEPLNIVAENAGKYLASFSKTILILPGALSIIKSYQTCLRYSLDTGSALADLCMDFLCRRWLTVTGIPEKGAVYNQHVDFLLKTYFSSVENKLEMVRITAKIALDEIGGMTGKDSTLKTMKTINKGNFPLLYRTLCEALVSGSAKEFFEKESGDRRHLDIWNKIVETLLILVEIAKIHSSRVILASLLKRSQSIIQLFLSKGMVVVQSALRVKSVEVLTLLKSFQIVTRFLHSICCHSRITNDSLVAAYVPAIRSQCERLTLEVKGMLILNGIPMDCITIAILKNKDIKGNDIISQETLEEDSDNDSELPPEDTPVAEENEGSQECDSESY